MTREQRARYLTARAIKDEILMRGDCAVTDCPRQPVDAHHEDYDEPLNVVWLCRLHHLMRHREYASVAAMLDYFDGVKADFAAARLERDEEAA